MRELIRVIRGISGQLVSNCMKISFAVLVWMAVSAVVTKGSHATEPERRDPAPIFPKALAPGDTVEIIAPAKYLDKDRVSLVKKRLEEMGFKVRIPENLFRKKGFLGGSDEERAAELNAAFADPEVKAIFPGTGGYGTTRIVDKLDYDVIRRNPKILVGFSDITGLHIAINQRTGLVTFHSPNPEWGLGVKDDLSPFAAKWFWRAILAKSYAGVEGGRPSVRAGAGSGDPRTTGVSSRDRERRAMRNPRAMRGRHAAESPEEGYLIVTHARKPPQPRDDTLFKDVPEPVTLRGGKGRGRLIGGNVSVVHALMGTPYEIQTDGKILFLEDVGEAPYRIDRMLNTLRLAGKFDHLAGVILGQFSARKDEAKWDDDESIDDVLKDFFGKLHLPVVTHFPIGHVRFNTTLPVGAMAELDADGQTLRILENPVVIAR
jgi:muramoyltetrapeptide carboxypeptidase